MIQKRYWIIFLNMHCYLDLSHLESAVNEKFYPLFFDTNRYLICWGGAGSSKSYFLIQKFLIRILKSITHNYKEKFLFLRKHSVDCRRTVFSLTKELISKYNLSNLCKINESSMTIHFCNGSEILHIGCDDPEKIKSIPSISSVFCEEVTDFDEADIQQLDLRLRGHTSSYKQIAMAFNPITVNHWIKKKFFDQLIPNTTIHHSTYRDNKWLDKPYIETLENILDPTIRSVYCDGLWGVLEHSIFRNFEITNNLPTTFIRTVCGLDLGFHHPALLKVSMCPNCDDIWITDEVYPVDKTLPELSDLIIDYKKYPIIADSEDPGSIKELQRFGFRVRPVAKTKDSIRNQIDWLKCRKIHIHESCVNTLREIQSYTYKKDKYGNIFDEPDNKCVDHAMDALRYAVSDIAKSFKFEYHVVGPEYQSSTISSSGW